MNDDKVTRVVGEEKGKNVTIRNRPEGRLGEGEGGKLGGCRKCQKNNIANEWRGRTSLNFTFLLTNIFSLRNITF